MRWRTVLGWAILCTVIATAGLVGFSQVWDEPARETAGAPAPETGATGSIAEQAAKDASRAASETRPYQFLVSKRGASIALVGSVPSDELRIALLARARGPAVASSEIADRLSIAPDAPDGFGAAALFAVERVFALGTGEVFVTGTEIVLRGEPADAASYAALLQAARGMTPAGFRVVTADLVPPLVQPYRWSLRRDEAQGVVTLSGAAPSEGDQRDLEAAARAAFPALRVEAGGLSAARGLPPEVGFAEVTRFALAQVAMMRDGTVDLVDGALSIVGDAMDKEALASLGEAARIGLPRGTSLARFAVTVRPVSPYVFGARRGVGILRLTGYVPDAETRESLRAITRKRFFGEQVVDETRLADGAPGGFATAVALGLDHLAQLASGEVRSQDASLAVTGEALYAGVARQLQERLPRSAPPGWAVAADIQVPGANRAAQIAACQALVDRALAQGPVRFTGVAFAAEPADLVTQVAEAAARCPAVRLEVSAVAEKAGEEDDLVEVSRRRAQALADRLVKAGVPVSRVSALGRGEAKESPGGAPAAAVVEIVLKP